MLGALVLELDVPSSPEYIAIVRLVVASVAVLLLKQQRSAPAPTAVDLSRHPEARAAATEAARLATDHRMPHTAAAAQAALG